MLLAHRNDNNKFKHKISMRITQHNKVANTKLGEKKLIREPFSTVWKQHYLQQSHSNLSNTLQHKNICTVFRSAWKVMMCKSNIQERKEHLPLNLRSALTVENYYKFNVCDKQTYNNKRLKNNCGNRWWMNTSNCCNISKT